MLRDAWLIEWQKTASKIALKVQKRFWSHFFCCTVDKNINKEEGIFSHYLRAQDFLHIINL